MNKEKKRSNINSKMIIIIVKIIINITVRTIKIIKLTWKIITKKQKNNGE